MNKEEIFKLIHKNPAFHLGTAVDNIPHVRGMMLYSADESGIVFHSGIMKEVHQQIVANPRVELCFNDFQNQVQLRVKGQLELVEDKAFKKEISEHPSRTFLKPWIESIGMEGFYASFAVYRLKGGQASTWTMDKNLEKKEWIQL